MHMSITTNKQTKRIWAKLGMKPHNVDSTHFSSLYSIWDWLLVTSRIPTSFRSIDPVMSPLPNTAILLAQLYLMPAASTRGQCHGPAISNSLCSLLHLLGSTFTFSCNVLLKSPCMEFHPGAYSLTSGASCNICKLFYSSTSIAVLNAWKVMACAWGYWDYVQVKDVLCPTFTIVVVASVKFGQLQWGKHSLSHFVPWEFTWEPFSIFWLSSFRLCIFTVNRHPWGASHQQGSSLMV